MTFLRFPFLCFKTLSILHEEEEGEEEEEEEKSLSLSLSLSKPAVPKVSAVAVAVPARDKEDEACGQNKEAVEHARRSHPPAAAQPQPRGRPRQGREREAVGEEERAAGAAHNIAVAAAVAVSTVSSIRVDVRPPHGGHQDHRESRQDAGQVANERQAVRGRDGGVCLGRPSHGEEGPREGRAVGGNCRRHRRRELKVGRRGCEGSEEALEGAVGCR